MMVTVKLSKWWQLHAINGLKKLPLSMCYTMQIVIIIIIFFYQRLCNFFNWYNINSVEYMRGQRRFMSLSFSLGIINNKSIFGPIYVQCFIHKSKYTIHLVQTKICSTRITFFVSMCDIVSLNFLDCTLAEIRYNNNTYAVYYSGV